MKKLIAVLVLLFFSGANLAAEIRVGESSKESFYELPIALVDQQGKTQPLNLYRGHAVIVTLFYGSCPNACPLLIESIRATERALAAKTREDLRVLMITIDPQRDTPSELAKLVSTRRIDSRRWTVARVTEDDVRLLAAVLGIQYRRLPDGEFNHASVLTLLSPDGELGATTTMLGKPDADFVAAIEHTAAVARAVKRP